jgi:putative phosphoribosyl transferase
MNRPFANRREAGVQLASKLYQYAGRNDVVVLALPRGGVPVAFEVAEALNAPLDIFLVRKLGLPGHPELAMGAIASGGVRVLNDEVVRWYCVPDAAIEAVARAEQARL